jgi:hypothetical protein
VSRQNLGDSYWQAGQIQEALQFDRQGLEDLSRVTGGAVFSKLNTIWLNTLLTAREADDGDWQHADANLAVATATGESLTSGESPGGSLPAMEQCMVGYGRASIAMWRGDYAGTRRITQQVIDSIQGIKPTGGMETHYQNICTFFSFDLQNQAAFAAGDDVGAERAARAALAARSRWPVQTTSERRDQAEAATGLGLALARQGRAAEALEVSNPVIKFQRELAAQNHGDQWQHVELAAALYVRALADPPARASLLHEAAALVDSVPAPMRALHSVRRWSERIRAG